MQITAAKLTGLAALAAVAAGTLFIAVQIAHPAITLDFVHTTQWKVRSAMKILMASLALGGITGIYLRQLRQVGLVGLVGYLLLGIGYLSMLCVEMIALVVVPTIAATSPDYVGGIIAVATNRSSTAELGLFTSLNLLVAAGYLLGGLVFGIAVFRARVLARWAAALLAVAAVLTMTIPFLPMVNQRLFAVVNGVAMIGLGWSLWRERDCATADSTATSEPHELVLSGRR